MKKVLYVLVAAAFLLALLPAAASAHTADEPFTTDLLAGQDIDVGDVLVWNDGDYLYVKYDITDPDWCLAETHLQVATSLDGIPQKNGNPIPGQFEYKNPLGCVDGYTYEIPLTWDPDTELYIAAHALVRGPKASMTVVSTAGDTVYGPLDTNPGLEGDWGEAKAAVLTQNLLSPPWSWPAIADATWISTALDTEQWTTATWRRFSKSFDVPGYPAGGSLTLTADNEYWAYLGGALLGHDDNIFNLETLPFTPVAGTNTFDFLVQNWSGSPQGGNPNGLVYKAEICYYAGQESAWDAGEAFPGKNWATYSTYTVQGGPTVTEGAPSMTTGAGARFRSLANTGADEIYLGPNMGAGGYPNRTQAQFSWVNPGSNAVTFTYDPVADKLVATAGATTLEYPDISAHAGCPVGDWDVMQIYIANRDDGTTVNFNDVMLGDYALGSFSGGTGAAGNTHSWTVTGYDFGQGFTISGSIQLAGTFSFSQELSKVEIDCGCSTP